LVEITVQIMKKGLYKNMDYRKGIHVIGTYNYHSWPWDIDSTRKHPLHHFPPTFCFLGVNPNYWHSFIRMWLMSRLIWMIWPMCGFKLVNNVHPCLEESYLWQWRTWPSHNTNIDYNMQPFMEVDIDSNFGDLNLKIIFICNKQHPLHWM
jgi:hypothetical protein